jgi:predicted methyltransferase
VDSHPVIRESYGFRVTAFTVEQIQALNPNAIVCTYSPTEELERRIHADPQGRVLSSPYELDMHVKRQATVAVQYGMILGKPTYLLDTSPALHKVVQQFLTITKISRQFVIVILVAFTLFVRPLRACRFKWPSHGGTMAERREIDLKAAINAISDVVQNRPRPLREMDQIYMKTGDMVLQSEMVAKWADGKKLAFIGDGDAISVSVAYLMHRKILNYGPTKIQVFDFDERICNAIKRFADRERIDTLDSTLYNVLDAFPDLGEFDCFYTNPPWGASNGGASVNVFSQRGMEAVGNKGEGMIVIADDHELEWPQQVLAEVQRFALDAGFFIQRMASKVHLYHLDDNPDLRSCNLMIKSLPGIAVPQKSEPITDAARLEHFYGKDRAIKIKYVRELKRVDYGKAHDDEYRYEKFGEDING